MQEEEKLFEFTRVVEMVNELDETQLELEGMAYNILNCSDLMKNAVSRILKTMQQTGILELVKENQAIFEIFDCLEELSTYTESMSMCAHSNEEFSIRQHTAVDEVKDALEYYYSKLSSN